MTGTVRAGRRTPTRRAPADQRRPRPAGTRATGTDRTLPPGADTVRTDRMPLPGADTVRTDRTLPPGTDTVRAAAVHPVPKSFRSKERQS
ncbi:hypothetical protein OG520_33505 [Streptomyces sp. NBC_00984]|uniref:hypothetical protein n=1 Tax=Streptomyces sp. NBC_00984 TaxID=2903700 RepID=UPI00386FD61E|nr:hypothetical protein OG520_33505 [Streptomyces sp. NBC_00984]